jgi:hypothetical protein
VTPLIRLESVGAGPLLSLLHGFAMRGERLRPIPPARGGRTECMSPKHSSRRSWNISMPVEPRFPAGTLLQGLLAPVRMRTGPQGPLCLCADMNAMPLPGVAIDMVWSNLALHWVSDAKGDSPFRSKSSTAMRGKASGHAWPKACRS